MMVAMKLGGDVTENMSTTQSGTVEPGCRIRLHNSDFKQVEALFKKIKTSDASIQCAHVKEEPYFKEGCIWNQNRASLCPQNSCTEH